MPKSLHGERLETVTASPERRPRWPCGAVADGAGWSSLPTSLHCPPSVSGTTHGHSRARCECEEEGPAEDVRSHRVLGAREVHLFSASMDRIYALKLRCEAGGLRRHAVDQRLPLACAPRDRKDRGGRGGHRSVDGGAPRRGGCDLAAISRAQASMGGVATVASASAPAWGDRSPAIWPGIGRERSCSMLMLVTQQLHAQRVQREKKKVQSISVLAQ